MKKNFDGIMNKPIDIASQIKKCFDKGEMTDFFSRLEVKSKSAPVDKVLVLIRQAEHIQLFLMMYLGYLNKLVKDQINESFGNDWKEKNIGYVILVEKLLLDNVIGPRENLIHLLVESGMLQKAIKCRKSRLITQGEGILPVIEKKLDLKLPLKSYFVMAQLHENYIQFTLHQVIKTLPTEENAATIIVRDKIIPIENVNDTLCKNIWNHIKSTKKIVCCTSHSDSKDTACDIFSLQNYINVLAQLRQYLSEIVSTNLLFYQAFD